MRITTRYAIGEQVYAIGQPEEGCQCGGCEHDVRAKGSWKIMGLRVGGCDEFRPLTISAILVLPDAEHGVAVYYATEEVPGEFFAEKRCFPTLEEAGTVTDALNSRPAEGRGADPGLSDPTPALAEGPETRQ